MSEKLDLPIKWLVMLGFLTLPYTHFNFVPDLGTTRPISVILFAIAFALVVIQALAANRFSLAAWWHWPLGWDNWPMLRWWVWLTVLGILSAAITPFYGQPVQALIRLLGYFAIFTTLFMAAYSLPRFGIKTIARWVLLGYLPALAYAVVESLAILKLAWASQFILWFRAELLVSFPWGGRIALFATEPSFVGFQILLLFLLVPYVPEKWLRWCGWILIVLCLGFTLSGTLIGITAIYLVLWGLFSLSRRFLSRLALVTTGAGVAVLLAGWLVPGVTAATNMLAGSIFSGERLQNMMISVQIRYNYILNLVYSIIDTKGLGLGIGQYGYFWKEIFLRHIDYPKYDIFGEVQNALNSPTTYMKPWSVILGIGVDLGLAGLGLLIGFLWQVYQGLAEPRHRALFFACLAALAGAYPIVTPHVWLALALMSGFGLELKTGRLAA